LVRALTAPKRHDAVSHPLTVAAVPCQPATCPQAFFTVARRDRDGQGPSNRCGIAFALNGRGTAGLQMPFQGKLNAG
jgi:hypothetical protein